MSLFNTHRVILIIALMAPTLGTEGANAANLSCKNLFDKHQVEKVGAQFLIDRNANFHKTPSVQRTVKKINRQGNQQIQKPTEQVVEWLKQISALHEKALHSPLAARRLKEIFYKQTLIKSEDIPNNYFELQIRIARERGRGELRLSESRKAEMIESLIKDQRASLDTWLDYMLSPDTSMYPPWVKYWILSGVVKLSKFHPEAGTFGHRDKGTVAPFPDLNREALAYVIDSVLLKANKKSLEEIQDPTMAALLDGTHFGKLYGYSLAKAGLGQNRKFTTNMGQWVLYQQGTDPLPLVRSLKGKNTGWCTAGLATARSQLTDGDFHVYYSLDAGGATTLPRIAIRMEGSRIAEIRGVDENQNLDGQIINSEVLTSKINEFGERGTAYLKNEQNMKLLTAIDSKQNIGTTLSKDELIFLYELEHKIEGFGYERDKRIGKILSQRNELKDLALIFDVSANKISTQQNSKKIKSSRVHFGDWIIKDAETSNFYSIQRIQGNVIVRTDVLENITFPPSISGELKIGRYSDNNRSNPRIIKNVIFPNVPELTFARLSVLENVTFPIIMKKLIIMGPRMGYGKYLKPVNVILPKTIDSLELSVDSAQGLSLPDSGSVLFHRLNTYKGMKIPENFIGELSLPIKDLENLVIPDNFQGTLLFQIDKYQKKINEPNLDGFKIPKNFKGRIELYEYADPFPGDHDPIG